jgi:hypothetical protein
VKQPKKKSVERFPGLSLKEEERRALAAMRAGRKRLSIRRWRRIRILELLDKGWTMQDAADAAGTYPREVRRIGRRYLRRGLEAALTRRKADAFSPRRGQPSCRWGTGPRDVVGALLMQVSPDGFRH